MSKIRQSKRSGLTVITRRVRRSPFRLAFVLLATFAVFSSVPAAKGDNPRGGGLSQLEFDKPVVATPPKGDGPNEHDIKVILEGGDKGKAPGDAPGSGKSSPGMQIVASPQKLQHFEWVKPADGQGHFLTPRLRGPQTDPQHPTTISTELKWGKQNGSCDVSRPELLCEKARSLKELMFRFSGDPDFYERQCQQKCTDPSMQVSLTAFRVKDRHGQAYDVLQAGERCRYQLGSSGGKIPWLAMEGEGGTCICLPKGCVQ